jgi:hypothetical protein
MNSEDMGGSADFVFPVTVLYLFWLFMPFLDKVFFLQEKVNICRGWYIILPRKGISGIPRKYGTLERILQ